ncbi:hypothetical protein [Dyella sp.]|jgi:hypothetical protein|uniref:hypothetical protein n=1 Tax=Dyella sp. TaxID=1869338 RepID=UPI002D796A33|nr:hypothetical protein [Dyella sp.]HET6431597.1 hypothetical protein [Dyella sp.]
MRFVLPATRRSRHPLARAVSVILGLAVVGVLMVFGLVVAGVLLVGGVVLLAIRQWKAPARPAPARPAARAETLEGEFVVLHDGHRAAH